MIALLLTLVVSQAQPDLIRPRTFRSDGAQRVQRSGTSDGPSSTVCPTCLTGLVRYYPLNGNGNDVAGGANATVTNVVWGAGKVGGSSADIAGNTTRTIVASGLNLMTDLSLAAWVYWASTSGSFYPVICNMDGGGGPATNYNLMHNGTGTTLALYGTGNVSGPANTGNLGTGSWRFVVATRTTGGSTRLYVDGVLSGTSPGSGPAPNSVPAADFRIGGREDSFSAFPGRIEQVGVWNRLLTQDEITALYNAGAGTTYPF